MKDKKVILEIAATDPTSGAGLQEGIRVATLLGLYPVSAVTAVTVQDSRGVSRCRPVGADLLLAQLDSAIHDFNPDAVKIGLLPDADTVMALRVWIERHPELKNIVLDPVLAPTKGTFSTDAPSQAYIAAMLGLASDVDLLTPNLHEAKILSGSNGPDTAAAIFRCCDVKAVLIKGGHGEGENSIDRLYLRPETISQEQDGTCGCDMEEFSMPRIDTENTHGSGCVLSSAIACRPALGDTLADAIDAAKHFLHEALEAGASLKVADGYGPALY